MIESIIFCATAKISSLAPCRRQGYDALVDQKPPPDLPPPAYLTVAQAAASLGIATQTLRGVILRGRIPVTRTYGRVLVAPADVEEYRDRSQPEGVPKRGRPRRSPDQPD